MSENSNSLAGTHKARAQEWALGMSSTGKEQIAVMFTLAGGPHDGKHITWFGYFTDGTVDRTLESMRHCGWASDSIAELDTLADNEVELVIEDEEYDGKVRSRVKWVNRIYKLAMKEQMNPAQMQAFANKLRGKTIASKQKYGATPAPASNGFGGRPKQASFAPDDGYATGDPGPTDADLDF